VAAADTETSAASRVEAAGMATSAAVKATAETVAKSMARVVNRVVDTEGKNAATVRTHMTTVLQVAPVATEEAEEVTTEKSVVMEETNTEIVLRAVPADMAEERSVTMARTRTMSARLVVAMEVAAETTTMTARAEGMEAVVMTTMIAQAEDTEAAVTTTTIVQAEATAAQEVAATARKVDKKVTTQANTPPEPHTAEAAATAVHPMTSLAPPSTPSRTLETLATRTSSVLR
jgi:hypothetical protein